MIRLVAKTYPVGKVKMQVMMQVDVKFPSFGGRYFVSLRAFGALLQGRVLSFLCYDPHWEHHLSYQLLVEEIECRPWTPAWIVMSSSTW